MSTTSDLSAQMFHRPLFKTRTIQEKYKEQNPVYVVTTEFPDGKIADVFYTLSPSEEFSNRYFGIFMWNDKTYVFNADSVEEMEFVCIETPRGYSYSRSRHDFNNSYGKCAIDGGREYTRIIGEVGTPTKTLRIKDGKWGEKQ